MNSNWDNDEHIVKLILKVWWKQVERILKFTIKMWTNTCWNSLLSHYWVTFKSSIFYHFEHGEFLDISLRCHHLITINPLYVSLLNTIYLMPVEFGRVGTHYQVTIISQCISLSCHYHPMMKVNMTTLYSGRSQRRIKRWVLYKSDPTCGHSPLQRTEIRVWAFAQVQMSGGHNRTVEGEFFTREKKRQWWW